MSTHTIWNSEIDLKDWEDFRKEEHPELEMDSLEWYKTVSEMNNTYLDDERMNLDIETKGEILAIADLGLWNGRHQAYKELGHNVANCLQGFVRGNSELHIFVEGSELQAEETHHDGTNHYMFREVRANCSERALEHLKDMLYEGTATQEDIDKCTKPMGRYPAKVYGWKLERPKKEAVEKE